MAILLQSNDNCFVCLASSAHDIHDSIRLTTNAIDAYIDTPWTVRLRVETVIEPA